MRAIGLVLVSASAVVGLVVGAGAASGSNGAGLTTPMATGTVELTDTTTPTDPAASGSAIPTPTPTPTTPPSPTKPPAPAPGLGFRIVQANLLSGQVSSHFLADRNTVMSLQPDFVTYNEVAYRSDANLAPTGFAVWRTPGKYTGETAVAWRVDRWTVLARGTTPINQKHGICPGREVELGMRYANWVTLRNNLNGRVLSVVSGHLPPTIRNCTDGLMVRGMTHLAQLAQKLSASGPVLVGGDMNVHYKAAVYPRALLAQYAMSPTYDLLHTYFPTGDHYGATIDYVFARNFAASFRARSHFPTSLYSDHDAVAADFVWNGMSPSPSPTTTPSPTASPAPTTPVPTTPAPTPAEPRFAAGVVRNRPHGDLSAKRRVLTLMADAISAAPAGSAIHLSTTRLDSPLLARVLRSAELRGVHTQVIWRNRDHNRLELSLATLLGHHKAAKSWSLTCKATCERVATQNAVPPTRLLISQAGATTALRMDVNRAMTRASVHRPSRSVVRTTVEAYDGPFRVFFQMVGIPL